MTDWPTVSSLATAGGTLVLAIATFAAVRSGNQSARTAERALRAGAVMDASGQPVRHGNVVLKIHFKASMHNDDGSTSLRRSVGSHDALVFGGDFENNVTWYLTVPTKTPFRADYIGGSQVAVDVIT